MQKIAQGIYSKEDVIRLLQSNRKIAFEYHLLDNNDNFIKKLDNIISCSIEFNSLGQIKRTARITLRDNGDIDYLKHRIQPWVVFLLPDGSSLKWAQGIFLLNSPTEKIENNNSRRTIECYDKSQILLDDKVTERYTINKDAKYTIEIKKILTSIGETTSNITDSNSVLNRSIEFDIGTSKLEIVNSLLDGINYNSITVGEDGVFFSGPYILPTDRYVEFTYQNNGYGVYVDGLDTELDLFDIPNVFVAYVSNPEQTPVRSVYTNDNPESQTSTISRGRNITKLIQLDDIADQMALDGYVRKIAYNANKVYGKLSFQTCIMPFHSYNDTYRFIYNGKIDAIYNETSWSMDLKVGGMMNHNARRVVNI